MFLFEGSDYMSDLIEEIEHIVDVTTPDSDELVHEVFMPWLKS